MSRCRAGRGGPGCCSWLGGLVVAAGVLALVWMVPPLLYGYVPEAKERAKAEATTRTGCRRARWPGCPWHFLAEQPGLPESPPGPSRSPSRATSPTATPRPSASSATTSSTSASAASTPSNASPSTPSGITPPWSKCSAPSYAPDSIARSPHRGRVLSAFIRERSRPDRTEKPTVAEVLQSLLADSPQRPADESQVKAPATDVQAALTSRPPARQAHVAEATHRGRT